MLHHVGVLINFIFYLYLYLYYRAMQNFGRKTRKEGDLIETKMYIEDIIKTKLKVIGFVGVGLDQMSLNTDQRSLSCV